MIFIRFFLIIFLLSVVHPAFSFEEGQDPDNSDYSYGEVVSAGDQDISVLEYEYEADQERTVRYQIKSETILTNVKKAADLVKGDTVEVYFRDEGGVKVAQTIIKDDTSNPVDDQTPSP